MSNTSVKEEESTPSKIMLADRLPAVFQIFIQWVYFGTIPDRFGLSRMSTGKSLSNSFLLWTLGDDLQASEFKNRIMRELYTSYSLEGYTDEFLFIEFSSAEVDYCWSQTKPGSKLRTFILDTLSHHITFGDYIRVTEKNDWNKTFTKHSDLQLQVLATIAGSFNTYSQDITEIAEVNVYLEEVKIESEERLDEPDKL